MPGLLSWPRQWRDFVWNLEAEMTEVKKKPALYKIVGPVLAVWYRPEKSQGCGFLVSGHILILFFARNRIEVRFGGGLPYFHSFLASDPYISKEAREKHRKARDELGKVGAAP